MAMYLTTINKKVYIFDGFTEKGAMNKLLKIIGGNTTNVEFNLIEPDEATIMMNVFDKIEADYVLIPQRMGYICAAYRTGDDITEWALTTMAESKEVALEIFNGFISQQSGYFGRAWIVIALKLKELNVADYETLKVELNTGIVKLDRVMQLATEFTD